MFEFKDDGKFGNGEYVNGIAKFTKILTLSFSSPPARKCAAQAGRNIKVPIAVGVALAVLVSVVVVVYILSRLRKRRLTSYQSLN